MVVSVHKQYVFSGHSFLCVKGKKPVLLHYNRTQLLIYTCICINMEWLGETCVGDAMSLVPLLFCRRGTVSYRNSPIACAPLTGALVPSEMRLQSRPVSSCIHSTPAAPTLNRSNQYSKHSVVYFRLKWISPAVCLPCGTAKRTKWQHGLFIANINPNTLNLEEFYCYLEKFKVKHVHNPNLCKANKRKAN